LARQQLDNNSGANDQKKEVSPYTVNSKDTFEHLTWRLN